MRRTTRCTERVKHYTRWLPAWCVRWAFCGAMSLAVGVSLAEGQTELFRFSAPPPVVVVPPVVQPAVPVVTASPVVATSVPAVAAPVTTVWRVPVTSPVTTTYFAPTEPTAIPASEFDSSSFGWANDASTGWTPVSEPVTSYSAFSPVVPEVPSTATIVEPTTTFYSPAAVVPVVPTVPVPSTVTVFRPTVTYQPVVVPAPSTVAVPVAQAVPVGPRVTVRPKVYVEGQPLRNLWRAITP